MHVRVGGAGPDGRDDLAEFTSPELLARHRPGHDVGGRDRPGNGTGLRTRLGPGWTGVRRRAAEPDDNAAVHAQLGNVDVGLCHRPLQPAVRQLVVDRLIVPADRGAELAAGPGGHRGHLLVADQRGLDALGAGHARGDEGGEQDRHGGEDLAHV